MNAVVSPSQAQSLAATKADSDQKLLASWLDSSGSAHTRRAYNATGARFLAILACPLRSATVEDVRDALNTINTGRSAATSRQHTLRVKSLLSYAHKLGYTLSNAGAAIKPPKEARGLAKRILAELDVRDLIRGAGDSRNYLLLRHAHASHSLDRGAPLSVIAATLGHDNISTTSAYLHAKPGATSGDALDAEVWKITPEA
jgi:site-specific recombinase XerD